MIATMTRLEYASLFIIAQDNIHNNIFSSEAPRKKVVIDYVFRQRKITGPRRS